MFLVCLLLQLVFVTVCVSVPIQDCGSLYEIKSVDIEGCSTKQLPCYITAGDDVNVNIQFDAGAYFRARNLDQNVVIDINQIHLSATVTPERCDVHCPVQNTGSYTSFVSVMTVPSRIALNRRGHLRWRVTNEYGRLLLCFSVLVQTQSRTQVAIRQYQGLLSRLKNTAV